ncbi:hypothetical protein [Mycobacterium uberis]|uniref:hypothetical protein n=1 Tax=Mycobacterium uberis TaxID=2162698 RepID=UPI000E304693|nr:hypothetical protein [Mycobacterium uberis]
MSIGKMGMRSLGADSHQYTRFMGLCSVDIAQYLWMLGNPAYSWFSLFLDNTRLDRKHGRVGGIDGRGGGADRDDVRPPDPRADGRAGPPEYHGQLQQRK